MESEGEKQVWREVKIGKRFINAFRGLRIFLETIRHLFIYILGILIVLALGFYFRISNIEWILLVFAIGFVFITEAFNTSIEIDMNLTSPGYHPFARDTKDVAAAAVLLSTFVAIIVGCIVFLPKIFLII